MMIDFKYLFVKYKIKCTGILHVGSSTAQEAETYHELGVPEVIWIEAIPSVFEQAKLNVAKYKNNFAINACISDTDGVNVIFNISNNESQSSSYLQFGEHLIIHPSVRYVSTIDCVTIRLDTLLKHYDITGINFLNFDIQGAELDALKGMGDLLEQIDYCYLEINKKATYIGCPLVGEIDEFLKDFTRVETGQWVGDSWTDGFYVRKSLL